MKISIITVVYNNPQVGEALDSILSQRLLAGDVLEVIVIDGGSSSETLEVLEKYRSKLSIFISERDDGIYDAMNKGLNHASGDVIGTLNSDDFYQDEFVLAQVLEIFRGSDVQTVYGDLVYVARENSAKVIRYWKSSPFRNGLFEKGWMPPHPTFFARREVYEKFGRFDLDYHLASDFELTMRLLAIVGVSSAYIPKILVRMRLGGATNNSLKNIFKSNMESWRACRKNGLKVGPWFIFHKVLSRVPQFFKAAPKEYDFTPSPVVCRSFGKASIVDGLQ